MSQVQITVEVIDDYGHVNSWIMERITIKSLFLEKNGALEAALSRFQKTFMKLLAEDEILLKKMK